MQQLQKKVKSIQEEMWTSQNHSPLEVVNKGSDSTQGELLEDATDPGEGTA